MSAPDNYRVGWFFYILAALVVWWAGTDVVRIIGIVLFFGAWFWNAERTQRAADRQSAIEHAEEDFEKFDPELIALDREYDLLPEAGYYEGCNEEAARILAARRHRIQVLLNERGLLK